MIPVRSEILFGLSPKVFGSVCFLYRNFPQNEITESLHRGNSSHFLIPLTGYIFESDSVKRISWRSPWVPDYCDHKPKIKREHGYAFFPPVAKIFIWQGPWPLLIHLSGGKFRSMFSVPSVVTSSHRKAGSGEVEESLKVRLPFCNGFGGFVPKAFIVEEGYTQAAIASCLYLSLNELHRNRLPS